MEGPHARMEEQEKTTFLDSVEDFCSKEHDSRMERTLHTPFVRRSNETALRAAPGALPNSVVFIG